MRGPHGGRHAVEMALEVADHAVHPQARVLARERFGAVAHHALGDVHRDVALERARGVQRVQQHARLGRRARAELDQLGGARQRGQLARRPRSRIARSARVG